MSILKCPSEWLLCIRRFVPIAFFAVFLSAYSAAAQTPAETAPQANAEVLKLLHAGMSESVILDKIHASAAKFDTSADALITLKQAGATEAELKAILAQPNAPASQPPAATPSAAPPATEPSIEDTTKFIQDKLSGLGPVTYIALWQSLTLKTTGSNTWHSEISNVVADPKLCRLSYHWKLQVDNVKPAEEDVAIPFDDIHDILIEPLAQDITELNARSGHPEGIVTSTSPLLSVLLLRTSRTEPSTIGEGKLEVKNWFHDAEPFLFTDTNLAVRIGKAFARAGKLCDSKSAVPAKAPPEPF
jgi:hypothetical protein